MSDAELKRTRTPTMNHDEAMHLYQHVDPRAVSHEQRMAWLWHTDNCPLCEEILARNRSQPARFAGIPDHVKRELDALRKEDGIEK